MRHPILFAPRGRDLQILHVVSNCVLGYAHSGDNEWQVKMTEYGYHDDSPVVVTVKSIDEVIPALVERYENQPPSWHGDERLGYSTATPFGLLAVHTDKSGRWLAYRNDCALLHNGAPAQFITCEEAKRIAEAHLRDGDPAFKPLDNGFTWQDDPLVERWNSPND